MNRMSGNYKLNLSKLLQAAPSVFLFRHAPIWVSTRFLRILGVFYYILNAKERVQIERNIRDVFKDTSEAESIIKKTFEGIFSHYSEKLLMAYRNFDTLLDEIGKNITYSGLHHLDSALAKGGALVVTGHFGGVEFMPLALHLKDYPVSMVVAFQSEQLKTSLRARAAEHNVELIDGHSHEVVTEIVDSIHRGRLVVTECDEVEAWRTKGNKTIDAFGGEIKIDRTLDILCRRCGTSVLSAFMVRQGSGYCLTVDTIRETVKKEAEPISVSIFRKFEKTVMTFPEQWYEWKKFHKMRPEIA